MRAVKTWKVVVVMVVVVMVNSEDARANTLRPCVHAWVAAVVDSRGRVQGVSVVSFMDRSINLRDDRTGSPFYLRKTLPRFYRAEINWIGRV